MIDLTRLVIASRMVRTFGHSVVRINGAVQRQDTKQAVLARIQGQSS